MVKDTQVWERMKREHPGQFQGNTVPVRLLDMRAMWHLLDDQSDDTVSHSHNDKLVSKE